MSKRVAVLTAIRDLLSTNLSSFQVEMIGLDGSEAPATRPQLEGRLLISSGNPGDPTVDLSPLTYNYDHAIDFALIVFRKRGLADEVELQRYLTLISEIIGNDPTIGGLCDWCEFTAPTTETEATDGGKVIGRSAEFELIASYSTPHPLN